MNAFTMGNNNGEIEIPDTQNNPYLSQNLMQIKLWNEIEKPSINTLDSENCTPLFYACTTSDLLTVQYLIEEYGADPHQKDRNNKTPLHYACYEGEGSLEIVQYLIEQCRVDPNSQSNQYETPLEIACLVGNFDLVKYLIEKCAVDFDQEPLKFIALREQHNNIAVYLMTHHLAVEKTNKSEDQPPLKKVKKN